MSSRDVTPDSDSDSEASENDSFILYSQRPEWKDLKPVTQDDGINAVCVIDYTTKFRDTFNYFRAVLAADERSDRAFDLTTDCANLNPANYTIWTYRRVLLKQLNKDLNEELNYLDTMIAKNAKNYQVWHHRRVVVELLGDPSREKQFTNSILDQDAKNYHAWQHRQWLVSHFNLYDDELDLVSNLIAQDVRNNSAWNHRYFVISRTTGFASPEVVEREVDFTLSKISLTPNNESPWNYLRGVLEAAKPSGLNSVPKVNAFCSELFEDTTRKVKSPYLLGFMVDAIDEQLQQQGDKVDGALLSKAVRLTEQLANDCDKIRQTYWEHIRATLLDSYESRQ